MKLKTLKIFFGALINLYDSRVKSRKLVDDINSKPISYGQMVKFKGRNFVVCSNINDMYTIHRSATNEVVHKVNRSQITLS